MRLRVEWYQITYSRQSQESKFRGIQRGGTAIVIKDLGELEGENRLYSVMNA